MSLMRENKLLELSEIGCVVTPVPKITDIRKRAGNPNIWILNVNTIIHFIACKNQPSKKLNSVVKVTEERFSTEQIKDGTRLKIISWDTGLENARN